MTLQQDLDLALEHHQSGRLAEAETIYRRILLQEANHPEVLHLLGVLAHQMGRSESAVEWIQRAIAIDPRNAAYHNHLGVAFMALGRLEQAIATYRVALDIDSGLAAAYNNIGNALKAAGKLDEAIASYRTALKLRPDDADWLGNLGSALRQQARPDEAITAYRAALQIRPNWPAMHHHLGLCFKEIGKYRDAVDAFKTAIRWQADYVEAHNNLALTLKNLGTLDEAVAAHLSALRIKPDFAPVHNDLGHTLRQQGNVHESIECFRRAIALAPDEPAPHSNLIDTMYFDPACNGTAILEECLRWNDRHAAGLKPVPLWHANDPAPDRRLRIGYISPDLKQHPVGRFLLPLLENHDHSRFQIYCYADVAVPDAITECLRLQTDAWRKIIGRTDTEVAELIRNDRIDLLIDLAAHTANHRLLVFARKPAPVQVTYLAYPGTTGVNAIDYRITDPYLDPPGANDACYSEESFRLSNTYWCYQRPSGAPVVSSLPALTEGFVTFGCLNYFCKVSEPVLATWTRLMRAIPNSRLVMHADFGTHRQRTLDLIASAGVDPERVRFVASVPAPQYFGIYGKMDLALDPFPYTGGTTTCDALWMGVPVVTLAGDTAVSRGGVSILSNAGLPELIAHSEDEYVRIAAELANDLPRLARLRETLRHRMQASPLMDAKRFALDIEKTYRSMWKRWCSGNG